MKTVFQNLVIQPLIAKDSRFSNKDSFQSFFENPDTRHIRMSVIHRQEREGQPKRIRFFHRRDDRRYTYFKDPRPFLSHTEMIRLRQYNHIRRRAAPSVQ